MYVVELCMVSLLYLWCPTNKEFHYKKEWCSSESKLQSMLLLLCLTGLKEIWMKLLYYETEEQVAIRVEHSQLAGTLASHTITLKDKILDDDVAISYWSWEIRNYIYTAMMLFNNGYAVMMDTSSMMMDNTLQVIIQPSKAKHSTYCYFSSTIEASAFSHCKSYND